MSDKLVSLCIPTNGIIEWVFPVLDSIFTQNVNEKLYEVVVTDNGSNNDFMDKMSEYTRKHSNLIYKHTDAVQFLNQIESFRLASGLFIKFVNHRTKMKVGTLQQLIDFVNANKVEKPIVFFSNSSLKLQEEITEYTSFDQFVKGLSYWSSWSGGIACWKTDFEKISNDMVYNALFPHTNILFKETKREKYIIDNRLIFEEIPVNKIAKGNYNLFYAFAVEYISILEQMLKDKSISLDTYNVIKNQNEIFLVDLYWRFIILKKDCSYDLSNYKDSLNVNYSYAKVRKKAFLSIFRRLYGKMLSIINKS